MFPDLFSATTEYWRQLDEIEYRYKQGELSIEEVDIDETTGTKKTRKFPLFQRYFISLAIHL